MLLRGLLVPLLFVLGTVFFENTWYAERSVEAVQRIASDSLQISDTVHVADTLSAGVDVSQPDTTEILLLEDDDIVLLEHTRIHPSAAKIRAESQRALPPDLRIRITEEANLSGDFYFALVRNALAEVQGRNNLYTVRDGNVPSKAYAVSLPIIDAIIDYRTRNIFRSDYEAEMYADTLRNRFRTRVEVVLFLRSYDVQLLNIERTDLFSIYIDARGDHVRPIKIIPAPIRSRVSGSETWFERRITMIFPRLSGGVDFWSDFEVNLIIQPKLQGLQIGENEQIVFNLAPD